MRAVFPESSGVPSQVKDLLAESLARLNMSWAGDVTSPRLSLQAWIAPGTLPWRLTRALGRLAYGNVHTAFVSLANAYVSKEEREKAVFRFGRPSLDGMAALVPVRDPLAEFRTEDLEDVAARELVRPPEIREREIELQGFVRRLERPSATLSTRVDGRSRRVRLDLTEEQHATALEAYRREQPVTVTGTLIEDGRRLMVRPVRRIELA
jgi:hypothetical protein